MIWLIVLVAVILCLWPSDKKRKEPEVPSVLLSPQIAAVAAPAPQKSGYVSAVMALQDVRTRLAATDKLDSTTQAAVDTITLALAASSDK